MNRKDRAVSTALRRTQSRVAELIEEQDTTLHALAHDAGVGPDTIYRWLGPSAVSDDIKLSTLARVACALGVPLSELVR